MEAPFHLRIVCWYFLAFKKVDQLAQIGVRGGGNLGIAWKKTFFSGTPVSIATSLPIASGWLTSAVGHVTDGEEKSASAVCAPPPAAWESFLCHASDPGR